jgi:hypothetical protein
MLSAAMPDCKELLGVSPLFAANWEIRLEERASARPNTRPRGRREKMLQLFSAGLIGGPLGAIRNLTFRKFREVDNKTEEADEGVRMPVRE